MTVITHQPVSDLQLRQLEIEWIPHGSVKPNAYNPNRMTPHDRILLRQSLLEDGWTQPIVTLLDGTIVDGEQRWTTAGLPLPVGEVEAVIAKMREREAQGYTVSPSIMERLEISRDRLSAVETERGRPGCLADVTGGLIPITRVDFKDDAHKMIATIRHNRARGTHVLDSMVAIVADLEQMGLDFDDLETRLGMDEEEAKRMLEQASLPDQAIPDDYVPSQAWQPVHLTELSEDDLAARGLARSAAVNALYQAHEQSKADRQQALTAYVTQVEAEAGRPLTQAERDRLMKQAERAIPAPPAPPTPQLRRLSFYVTQAEYDYAVRVLGDPPVQGLLNLLREEGARRGIQPESA